MCSLLQACNPPGSGSDFTGDYDKDEEMLFGPPDNDDTPNDEGSNQTASVRVATVSEDDEDDFVMVVKKKVACCPNAACAGSCTCLQRHVSQYKASEAVQGK